MCGHCLRKDASMLCWIWGATGNYVFINSWFDMIPTKFRLYRTSPGFWVFEDADRPEFHPDDFPSKGHRLPWWSFKAYCGHVSTGCLARMQPSRRLFKPSMRQRLWLMDWSHWRSSKLAYDLGLIWLVSLIQNNWGTSTSNFEQHIKHISIVHNKTISCSFG